MSIYYRRNDLTKFDYPDDMKLILDYLNEHGQVFVPAKIIEDMYYDFCYCCQDSDDWEPVNEKLLEEFEDWLNEHD